MLSLTNDGRYPQLDLTPQQRRQKTLEALVSQLEALARQRRVLMIFEDAHWTDPTSLEVFGRVVDNSAALAVYDGAPVISKPTRPVELVATLLGCRSRT
jgi:predicted ATPase